MCHTADAKVLLFTEAELVAPDDGLRQNACLGLDVRYFLPMNFFSCESTTYTTWFNDIIIGCIWVTWNVPLISLELVGSGVIGLL